MALAKPLKAVTLQGLSLLFKFKNVLIALIVIGLGVCLGYLFTLSRDVIELTISVLVILLLMVLSMRNPLNGLLALLFFMAFIESWVEIPMGAGIPDLSFSRFTIAFLAIFMLANAATGKFRFATPIGLTEICIVLATLGIMSAATLIDKPANTLQLAISRYFLPFVMYFFARNLVRNKEDLHKLLLIILLFGFAVAAYAIYEQWTGNILFVSKDNAEKVLQTRYTENLRLIRGLLGRSGNFGRVLITTIPVSFYLFFEYKGLTRKTLLVGVLIVQFYALFLTYNRTSWYTLLISLSIIQFFYPQFRKLYFVMVFVAVITLWATWDQLNQSDVVRERVNTRTEDYNGRTPRWDAAISMWEVKPIRGWGEGAFNRESGRFRTDGFRRNLIAVENDYLDMLVHFGLVAFLPYLIFLITPLVNSIRLFFRARAPDWSGFITPETITIYWCVIISFAIGSYTQEQTQAIIKMLPFALAGAIVGTHTHWLNGLKAKKQALSPLSATVERT